MQKTEEAAAEAEAQRNTRFGLESERRVVEAELFKRIAEVGVFCAVRGVDARVNHGLRGVEAGEGFCRGVIVIRNGIAHLRVCNAFDARGNVADLARGNFLGGHKTEGGHISYLDGFKRRARVHKAYGLTRGKLAVHHAHVDYNAAVGIVVGVENEAFKRRVFVALGRGNIRYNLFKNILDVQTCFCGNRRAAVCGDADNVLYLLAHTLDVCAGEVYFVYNGNDLEVLLQRKVSVGKSLRLDALRCVHNEKRAFASAERARNLVVEVDVSGCVDKVEFVSFAVVRFVVKLYCARFYGYTALALDIHIIEYLLLHIARGDALRFFKDSVGKGAFAVVYMCNNRKISYFVLSIHFYHRIFTYKFSYLQLSIPLYEEFFNSFCAICGRNQFLDILPKY